MRQAVGLNKKQDEGALDTAPFGGASLLSKKSCNKITIEDAPTQTSPKREFHFLIVQYPEPPSTVFSSVKNLWLMTEDLDVHKSQVLTYVLTHFGTGDRGWLFLEGRYDSAPGFTPNCQAITSAVNHLLL